MKTTKLRQYYVNNKKLLPLASVHRVAAINLHRLIAQFSSQLHLMNVFKWQDKLSIRRLRCVTFAFVIITVCALIEMIRSRLEAGAEIHQLQRTMKEISSEMIFHLSSPYLNVTDIFLRYHGENNCKPQDSRHFLKGNLFENVHQIFFIKLIANGMTCSVVFATALT